jgi:hypothetical protein
MKGFARVKDEDSKIQHLMIEVYDTLLKGDFIIHHMIEDCDDLTDDEMDNGLKLEIIERCYDTSGRYFFYNCKHIK